MDNRINEIVGAFRKHGGKRGLEVGVGYGELLYRLHHDDSGIVWEAVDIPNSTLRRDGLPKVTELDITKSKLPFADETFDCVCFSEVLEHLPQHSIVPIMKELRRVLAKDGVLITTTPNLTSLMNRILLLFGKSPFHLPISEVDDLGIETYPHIHLYTVSEYKGLGEYVGLKTVKVKRMTYLAYAFLGHGKVKDLVVWSYILVERLLSLLVPSYADGWLTVQKRA